MSNVIQLVNNGVSFIVNNINKTYESGEIEGLVVGIKLKNGDFFIGSSDELHFLEKLGLAQAIINDVTLLANFSEE